MAIHASERVRNVIRTILVWLASCDLAGAVLLPDGDERAPDEGMRAWVRVSVEGVEAVDAGRVAGTRAAREDILVIADVWHRGSAHETTAKVDAVDGIAEAVRFALTRRNLQLADYVTDPTGATLVDGVHIRFLERPRIARMEPAGGFQRRQVLAPALYFSRHTG